MDDYSGDRAAAREFLKKILFDAIRSGRYGRSCLRDAHIAANRAENIVQERARKARNEQARRSRLKAERLPAVTSFDPSRYRRDIDALKVWLLAPAPTGSTNHLRARLRPRVKEIALARFVYLDFIARTGKAPSQAKMASAMGVRTRRTWTRQEGRTALDWMRLLETEGGPWFGEHPESENDRPEAWGTF
ncbi:hypothetical protein K9U40_04925 [Xanthobacter autotrophicus]|uniref:hypothetical protein n=1 Tax=Xanthobacter TaxID=279 RepID=UPI0024AA1FC8|nr:hypothetical protein [Xanthobacter autotrophicus]MDI4663676.1 hypothetical protein [Xanthobacter autotrophicus]